MQEKEISGNVGLTEAMLGANANELKPQHERLGCKVSTKGGSDRRPPILARRVMLAVAGMLSVDCLDDHDALT